MHGQINYQDKLFYTSFFSTIQPAHFAQCNHQQYWVADIVIYQSYLLTYIYDYYESYNFTDWSMSINGFLFLRKNKSNNYDIFISYAYFSEEVQGAICLSKLFHNNCTL